MPKVRCVCGLNINAWQMATHLAGQRHQAELSRRGLSMQGSAAREGRQHVVPGTQPFTAASAPARCSCGQVSKFSSEAQRQEHLNGKKHSLGVRRMQRQTDAQQHSDESASDESMSDDNPMRPVGGGTRTGVPALSVTGSLCSCGEIVKLNSDQQRQEHLRGRKHQEGIQRTRPAQGPAQASDPGPTSTPSASNEGRRTHIPATAVRCDICNKLLHDVQAYYMHTQGEAHKRALTELAFTSISSGYIRCPICERDLPAARWEAHVEGDQYHCRRQQYADEAAQTQSAQLNRNGVSVTGEAGGIDFGTVEVDSVHVSSAECTLEVTVSNDVPGTLISLHWGQNAMFWAGIW